MCCYGRVGGGEGVVPLAVEVVKGQRQGAHLFVGDAHLGWVGAVVEFGVHAQAGAGGGGADEVDDDLVAGQCRPRQFMEMCANNRCSILFHLLVPGGRWQTVTVSPVSAAKAASSTFHSRLR